MTAEKTENRENRVDSVKGGSTYDIQKALSNVKRAKLIMADVKTQMANIDFQREGQLSPLQEIKNKISDYVDILLTFKNEKKVFGQQIQEKNKTYDEQLIKLENKYQKLEEDYRNFKKLKEELEKKYLEANKNDPAILALLNTLTSQSITYERDVRLFITKEVNILKNNFESLKNDAKNHTPIEHQRKIEAITPAASTQPALGTSTRNQ
jgi:DNA repair exonuclease SbcCD ATPase subunit